MPEADGNVVLQVFNLIVAPDVKSGEDQGDENSLWGGHEWKMHHQGAMNVCIKFCAGRCWDILLDKWQLWAPGGSGGRVRGSPKLVGFTLLGRWISVQNFKAIPPNSCWDILVWTKVVDRYCRPYSHRWKHLYAPSSENTQRISQIKIRSKIAHKIHSVNVYRWHWHREFISVTQCRSANWTRRW